jgi:hypothetical protein
MNSNVLITEGEKSSLNGFNILKRKTKKNSFFNIKIIIIFILFIIIFYLIFLIFKLEKKYNNIIKFSDNNNFLNQKIIEQLNFIEVKLQILEENQRILSNKEKIITNYNNNIYYLLSPMEVLGYNKIRIGSEADGGYIFLNDLKNIKIAYSFGIGSKISFDKELADKNIDIFMYDHTIDKLPFENSKFHWKKIGLSGKNINETNMSTLSELIKENGHSKEENMILKIDIESYEWEVFQYLPINIMKQFKYIVGEFHFEEKDEFQYYNIFKKIQGTHQIFHIHCNNCGRIIKLNGYTICNLLEISFIQKEGYEFAEDKNIYPIEGIDYKNCIKKKDISYLINLFNK